MENTRFCSPQVRWVWKKPHGLQGAVAQGVHAAPRHDLHGHTALKHAAVVKAVHLGLLRAHKLAHEGEVLVLIHGTVYIIRIPFVVAGGEEGAFHVHALERHDGGDGVVKMQVAVRAEGGDLLRDGVAREGACRDHDFARRDIDGFLVDDLHEGVGLQPFGDRAGKADPVHGEGSARRHAVLIGACHDERAHGPHLGLQQADGV